MLRKVSIDVGKIMVSGETSCKTVQKVGRVNTMNLPSVENKNSHEGKACIILSCGDNQKKVIVGTGGFIVP